MKKVKVGIVCWMVFPAHAVAPTLSAVRAVGARSFATSAWCNSKASNPCSQQQFCMGRNRALKVLAATYCALLNGVGTATESDLAGNIEVLFSPEFIKTSCGRVVARGRGELLWQLREWYKVHGGWTVEALETTPHPDGVHCRIVYLWFTKHSGAREVVVTFSSQDGVHIDAMDEVIGGISGF